VAAVQGRVHLDHAATTPVRPEVAGAMAPFASQRWGNPSGSHALARDAVRAVDEARERTAGVLGCAPGEVVFTSGGTEADVHAVSGGMPPRPGRPLCSAVEHPAVLRTVEALGGSTVPVDPLGRVTPDALADALAGDRSGDLPDVSVVSVMLANNEVGTVNDLAPLADVLRDRAPGVPLHTDAVQAAPWLDLAVAAAPADLVSVSAHKLGGPKGVGALVVRAGTVIRPLLPGGGQERGRRSGTTDVAGVVGLATALSLAAAEREVVVDRVRTLRDRLADGLRARVPDLVETVATGGRRDHLLPNFCHLLVPGADTESLLLLLDAGGVCASAASSCASGAAAPSHVLAALGSAGADAVVAGGGAPVGAVRLTLGASTTAADVERALQVVPAAVARVRDHLRVVAGS
jgi:cysteine desulfurase